METRGLEIVTLYSTVRKLLLGMNSGLERNNVPGKNTNSVQQRNQQLQTC